MYPNLEAEISRKGFTLEFLSRELGCTIGTMSLKRNGKSDFTLNEARRMKEILEVDIPIDVLFEEVAE